jgi:hypothetical protein
VLNTTPAAQLEAALYASFEAGVAAIRSFAARRQQQILAYPQR